MANDIVAEKRYTSNTGRGYSPGERIRLCQADDNRSDSQAPDQGNAPVLVLSPVPPPGRGHSDSSAGGAGAKPPPSIYPLKKVGIATLAASLREVGFGVEAEALEQCGQRFWRYRCRECNSEWVAPSRCGLRVCPECSRLRASRLVRKYEALLGRPLLKHCVLTSLPVRKLWKEDIQNFRSCIVRLLHRRLMRERWGGPGCGGIYAIELTYRAGRGWRIHAHLLIDGDFVPQKVLSRLWHEITGSAYVVWISRADNPRQALKYVVKPCREFYDDPDAVRQFMLATEGVHLIAGWGNCCRIRSDKLVVDMVCPLCGSSDVEFLGEVSGLDKIVLGLRDARYLSATDPPLLGGGQELATLTSGGQGEGQGELVQGRWADVPF